MNRHTLIPSVIAAWVCAASLTLITIVLKSPYTHSNLAATADATYNRTPQTFIGAPAAPFHGPGLAGGHADVSEVQRGRELLVANQCATCHGIDGRGGAVNKPIVGFTAAELRDKTSKGPGEMPSFGTSLSDSDLAAIAAYLDSMKAKPTQS